jgi:hypothetical protein
VKQRTAVLAASAIGAFTAAAPAQSWWYSEGHAAPIRVVGEQSMQLAARRATASLPAGDYAVHFGTDAAGKPMSLEFPVAEADAVRLAIESAPTAVERVIPATDSAWQEHQKATSALPTYYRTMPLADAAVRISATLRAATVGGVFGLVACFCDVDHRYRFAWDRTKGELRLERRLGQHDLILASAAVAALDDRLHTLTLQVQGFRLSAFVDEALVLEALDGALTGGSVGQFWTGDAPDWSRFVIEPAASLRTSAALVRRDGAATLHVGTVVSPGHFHVLAMVLDRPHALVPLTASGLELFLLQRPAAPLCLLADWRDSLGAGGIGEVPRTGLFASTLRWPNLPQLRHQAVMVGALLVTADGDVVAAASPFVPLVF